MLAKDYALTCEQIKQACRNIGYDLNCGQCASVFFTGSGTYNHDENCTTTRHDSSVKIHEGTMKDKDPILVILESPYAGNVELNTRYARACMLDSLRRGEAPMVSHLLYTQVLPDVGEDRKLGIEAGLAWGRVAQKTVVYEDLGISSGMSYGISSALNMGRPVEYRKLGESWQTTAK